VGAAGIGLYLLDVPIGVIIGAIVGVIGIAVVGAVAEKVGMDVRDVSAIAFRNIADGLVKIAKKRVRLPDIHIGNGQISNSIRRVIDGPEDDEALGEMITKGLQDLSEV